VAPAVFVCPVVWVPYKRMADRLRAMLAAADVLACAPYRIETTMAVTASAHDVDDNALCRHPRLRLLGQRRAADVTEMMLTCAGVVYPTEIESFGYPMAECRLLGTPVVARDSAHNREVAGAALVGYAAVTPEDFAAAFHAALHARPAPADPAAYDRDSYFASLLDGPAGATGLGLPRQTGETQHGDGYNERRDRYFK
jgi:glycosyltransferase involved in cell wall biosynthesis